MSFRPSVRRVLAYAAAGVAGVAATLIVATPAFAHHTTTFGVARCGPPGSTTWIVAWTVTGSNEKELFQITSVTTKSGPNTVTGAMTGDLNKAPFYKATSQTFTGDQAIPNSIGSVRLSAAAHFENNDGSGKENVSGTDMMKSTPVTKPTCNPPANPPENPPANPPAGAPAPTADPSSACGRKIKVVLGNLDGTLPAKFTVTGARDPEIVVPKGETKEITVPGENGEITIASGNFTKKFTWTQPAECPGPPPPPPNEALPVTGDTLTPVLSIGGALLVGGAGMIGLLFLLRRRRTVAGG